MIIISYLKLFNCVQTNDYYQIEIITWNHTTTQKNAHKNVHWTWFTNLQTENNPRGIDMPLKLINPTLSQYKK